MKRTAKDYNKARWDQNREFVLDYFGRKCQVCGYNTYPCSLELHHVDPTTKGEDFRHHLYWPRHKLLLEIQKCRMLCSNCHRAHHGGELDLNV